MNLKGCLLNPRTFKLIKIPPPAPPECRRCKTILLTDRERSLGVCGRCAPEKALHGEQLVAHLALATASMTTCAELMDKGWYLSLAQKEEVLAALGATLRETETLIRQLLRPPAGAGSGERSWK